MYSLHTHKLYVLLLVIHTEDHNLYIGHGQNGRTTQLGCDGKGGVRSNVIVFYWLITDSIF